MKCKIIRGKGFRGLMDYALGKDGAEVIGGTVAGASPPEYAAEFGILRRLRPDVARPVWHASLSLPPGERMEREDWNMLCDAFLRRMDFDPQGTQWVAVRHRDATHDHVHIIVNRIQSDGSLWYGQREVFRAIEATQEMEKDFHLTRTKGLERGEGPRETWQEKRMEERTGEPSIKKRLAGEIADILRSGCVGKAAFESACAERGIEVRANIARTGKMSGYSFSYQGRAFPGSKIGAGWKKLAGRIGEREKTDGEIAQDMKSILFDAMKTGFAAAAAHRGWVIRRDGTLFSPWGQEVDPSAWGVDPAEVDRAGEAVRRTPTPRVRWGIVPKDLEALAALAFLSPSVFAALIALDIVVRIGEATEDARRDARREAWEKVHRIKEEIEDGKAFAGDRGVDEKAGDRCGAEDAGRDGVDGDHDGALEGPEQAVGGNSFDGVRPHNAGGRERGVSAGERSGPDRAALSDDRGSAERDGAESRTGEAAHSLDCDHDELCELAARLRALADDPVEEPEEKSTYIEEEKEQEPEEPEQEPEQEAWAWGR